MTLPTLNSPPNQSITVSPLGRDRKAREGVRPPHSSGGADAGGFETAAAAERQGSSDTGNGLLRCAADSSVQGRISDTDPTCGCGKGCVQMVARVCWGSAR